MYSENNLDQSLFSQRPQHQSTIPTGEELNRLISLQKGRTLNEIIPEGEESSLLRDEMLLGNLGGPSPGQAGEIQAYENILFYDEHIDDDSHNLNLIDELFLNPKRKPIKVCKERSINGGADVNFSRIDTDQDGNDSDSSIT